MDADSWAARLSSTTKRYQYALQSRSSEMFMGFEDIEVDDDMREEFPCPFCTGYFDIVGLCCHIDDEHHLESKNGVCPVCAVRVGVDMVAHITLQHGNIFKMQQKRKSRKGSSLSTLSLLRRELREGNLQSLFGGSSYLAQSANVAPDPLLSSFILPVGDDLGGTHSNSSFDAVAVTKSTSEKASERKPESPPMSIEDKEEKSRRSEFVQGMLLSTILGDDYL
ncbi:putative drought induced 19 type, zinc-binding protein [Helianthus annuus]|nr:protein DEHYDRATION-INDUCED 19 homolog 3 [Helianthus annuus]KAJ0561273.1 putative drought induced 19 type, zinc-binding protein [Helianthus annuus]KAJ0567877.1 putative drought induced 19 type, zinc-binding protein [Helianthus annuus]KAJ0574322.1 putative drought induced 19 type, zinc-binding protein [Helianthus annuus]KAJ0738658.1 putative drought induced 19 type, zinc-binding protein [Helianthus annuus]KAJ0781038.1 putative drought induced 19 type, zinc-binding protein [Helianthus annuus]